MKNKVFIPASALFLLFIMGAYFLINTSYEKSLMAKISIILLIMLSSYIKLVPSVVTDEEPVKSSAK